MTNKSWPRVPLGGMRNQASRVIQRLQDTMPCHYKVLATFQAETCTTLTRASYVGSALRTLGGKRALTLLIARELGGSPSTPY
eukprot:4670557-Pleurochrysis_carterae.AAC.4